MRGHAPSPPGKVLKWCKILIVMRRITVFDVHSKMQ